MAAGMEYAGYVPSEMNGAGFAEQPLAQIMTL